MIDLDLDITCNGITQIYQTSTQAIVALDNVSFQVWPHQFIVIVGPSGCGKTTLLKIIAGLVQPTTGQVKFSQPPTQAMVFQEHGLFPWLTLLDNVAFGLETQGVARSARRQQAEAIITQMGLAAFAQHYPHQLSVGMRQRAGIARSLLLKPQILLMDEPFGSIDAQMKRLLQTELLQLWTTYQSMVVYVTHDIEEAILLGDRILVMSGRPGRIIADIPINLARPRHLELLEQQEARTLRWHIWSLLAPEIQRNLG